MSRTISELTVFTGKDAVVIDLSGYTMVVDNTVEFESSIDTSIEFYVGADIVRTMWNPSCDIKYAKIVEPRRCPVCGKTVFAWDTKYMRHLPKGQTVKTLGCEEYCTNCGAYTNPVNVWLNAFNAKDGINA